MAQRTTRSSVKFSRSNPPRRILVIQLRYVGDVLVTTPAVRALRGQFPEAEIDFLVERGSRPLVEENPHITRILEPAGGGARGTLTNIIRARRRRYDLIVDYQGSARTGMITMFSGAALRLGPENPSRRMFYSRIATEHRGMRYVAVTKLDMLRPLGIGPGDSGEWETDRLLPELRIPEPAREYVANFLDEAGIAPGEKLVSIDPTSRRETRRWTARGFADLADRVARSLNARVVFLWGPAERDEVAEIAGRCRGTHLLAPATDLMQLGALIERCDLHIGNDSGPRHIAVACGTPTLTILGSSIEKRWTFPDDRHRAVFEPVHCRPCLLKICPTELECMNQLTAEKVARAAEGFSSLIPRGEDCR